MKQDRELRASGVQGADVPVVPVDEVIGHFDKALQEPSLRTETAVNALLDNLRLFSAKLKVEFLRETHLEVDRKTNERDQLLGSESRLRIAEVYFGATEALIHDKEDANPDYDVASRTWKTRLGTGEEGLSYSQRSEMHQAVRVLAERLRPALA